MQLYEEARGVESVSPRAACMLLRLCVEKIASDLVPGSGDLNEKIGKMVKNGLPEDVRKAMDYVTEVENVPSGAGGLIL